MWFRQVKAPKRGELTRLTHIIQLVIQRLFMVWKMNMYERTPLSGRAIKWVGKVWSMACSIMSTCPYGLEGKLLSRCTVMRITYPWPGKPYGCAAAGTRLPSWVRQYDWHVNLEFRKPQLFKPQDSTAGTFGHLDVAGADSKDSTSPFHPLKGPRLNCCIRLRINRVLTLPVKLFRSC